ncbi:hypothetical protein TMEN_5696 [Trichophyton mentagrophytes]|uniref:Altered inheritance of mitochondria protein 9, mitochondrial n=1 Tax=Trichophyton interdigitale (strain MR816) TaxID=1215338 RepID=A0A059J6Q1_TRIIM|nr:hypothetical protein H101_06490 [Trichophyton interdigitale H6]KDB23479.1 hypothetical protein H109_04656 [Trichophyton interdigitale MR816]GBF63075.1 hypothetical protein TMEN_5696 [Trichophyton mentagrophytes]
MVMKRASSTRKYDKSDYYYRYTAGCWLFNEPQQLEARYVRFNIDALAEIAARCLGHDPASCVKIEKMPEGNFNKSLLLTMADGSQVIARVPNPNSGIPHFTTASEVATMDFARTKLGLLVLKETLQGEIITLIGMLLNDGELALQGLLMNLARKWDQLIRSKGGPPCPLQYSAEAIDHQQDLEAKWAEGIALMDDVLESLGGAIRGWDGWVSHEDYEALQQKLELARKQFIEHLSGDDKEAAKAWARAWPFQ